MLWAASTVWYFPITNFSPPQPSSPYGGPDIKDTNSNVQFVIASGKSQTPGPPAWPLLAQKQLMVRQHGTARRRSPRTLCLGQRAMATSLRTSAPGKRHLQHDRAAGSTRAARTTDRLAIWSSHHSIFALHHGDWHEAGSVNTISGVGSTDPQIDTVVIFRSTDGFQNAGPYLFLTEIPNPPVINGAAGAWSYKDYQPDTALNPLIAAPVNGANNPLPLAQSTPFSISVVSG